MDGFGGDGYCVVVSEEFSVIGDRAKSTQITDDFCSSEGGSFQEESSPVDFWGGDLFGHGNYRGMEQCYVM